MKFIHLILILFITASASSVTAQTNQTEAIDSQTESKAPWTTFAPDSEEFSVEAPTPFLPGLINTADPEKVLNRAYRTFIGETYCYVFSDPLKNTFQNKTIFEFAGVADTPNSENTVFRFTDEFGYHHRILMVKTQNKIYTFQTFGGEENNPYVDRFFRGIKINGKTSDLMETLPTVGRNNQPVKVNTAANATSPVKSPANSGTGGGTGSDSGNGSGAGQGNGSGNGAGNSSAPEAPKVQAIPLKLLSKPRPPYTDYARFYQITGIVRLKVTFLASGKIGTVTPVSKLPLGLTEQAITAARQIAFEPQQVNGQSQSVSKTVEYSFSIF